MWHHIGQVFFVWGLCICMYQLGKFGVTIIEDIANRLFDFVIPKPPPPGDL